jgi:hypothetical protein
MPGSTTNGYATILEIAERELERQFRLAAADVIKDRTVDLLGGRLTLNLDRPNIDLTLGPRATGDPTNAVTVTIPFKNSQVEQAGKIATPLEGAIEISDVLTRWYTKASTLVHIGMNLRASTATGEAPTVVAMTFSAASSAKLAALTPDTEKNLRGIVEIVLGVMLAKETLQIDFTGSGIPVGDPNTDRDAYSDVDFKVLTGPPRVLALLMDGCPGTGTKSAVTMPSLDVAGSGAITIANTYLLQCVIRPGLIDSFRRKNPDGSPGAQQIVDADFSNPCTLSHTVTLVIDNADGSTDSIDLEKLEATVEDGAIVVAGRLVKNVSGLYWAIANFRIPIMIELTTDTTTSRVTPSVGNPEIDTHVWVSPLAWVLTIFLLIFTLVGLILGVAAIIIEQLGRVSILRIFTKSITGALGNSTAPDASPLGLLLTQLTLDDLAIRGVLVPSDPTAFRVQRANQTLGIGQSLDLDSGSTAPGPTPVAGADLVWSVDTTGALALRAAAPARMATLGLPYIAVTSVDLEDVSYPPSGALAAAAIPAGDPAKVAVLAVRTDVGRYAKCAVWREQAGTLHVRYATYDLPVPSVAIQGELKVREERVIGSGSKVGLMPRLDQVPEVAALSATSGGGPPQGGGFVEGGPTGGGHGGGLPGGGGFGTGRGGLPSKHIGSGWVVTYEQVETFWADTEQAFRGDFHAAPTLLPFPIAYAWTLAGHPLSGSGAVTLAGHTIAFVVDGPDCRLDTELGKALDADLELAATDAAGQVQNARRHLQNTGSAHVTQTLGGSRDWLDAFWASMLATAPAVKTSGGTELAAGIKKALG